MDLHPRMLTIGDVAALADVPAATVRYYERRGLLAATSRTRAGYRQYGPDAAQRLRFIRHAQALGFSLEEIQELLTLRADDAAACPHVAAAAREKVQTIIRRIGELDRMKQTLQELIRSCDAHEPSDACPVLSALAEAETEEEDEHA